MESNNLEWNWIENANYLDENLPADTLDREKYAKFLYEICAARGEKSNLVVNINAEWGAGKTYFTKRLAQSISLDHPTVYIDAWKDDYSDDPLLTVFSSIKEQLTGQSDQFTELLNKTIENIGPLLKSATPLLLDGIVKKITGIEDYSDLTKDLSSKFLDLHSEKSTKMITIKKGITKWVSCINQRDGINKKLPLFIIIDELDRCRPDFAISLLEVTKHIFNTPGVVFIISTDTEQLQHSIKVIYGNDFSASHYLSRFFDRRFLLPSPKLQDFLKTITGSSIIDDFNNVRKKMSPPPLDFEMFINNCASTLEALKINLRDAIKLFERLIDVLITTNKNFDPIFFLILSCVNIKDIEIYAKLKSMVAAKTTHPFLEANFTIVFNLSHANTGVPCLRDGECRRPNKYETKNIEVTLAQYIDSAQSVILIENPVTPIYRQNYSESWTDGGLSLDESLVNYLKMGWALTKTYDLSLTLKQYHDLIELSTTFE